MLTQGQQTAVHEEATKVFFIQQFQQAMLMNRMTIASLEEIQEFDTLMGQSLKNACSQALNQMRALEKKMINSEKGGNRESVKKILSKERTFDIATLLDQARRIGNTESDTIYEEFLNLLTKVVESLVLVQTHQKNIHFSKYKALFALITSELKADVNKEHGQVCYQNGKLWLGVGSKTA